MRQEIHRESVHAIAQTRRSRSVVEHMAEVAAAPAAVNLRACHVKRTVGVRGDGVIERRVKARPAGVAVEFRARRKEL